MLQKLLLITLTAISLLSCSSFENPPPKEPDFHDCSVVVIKDEHDAYIWDEAYVFCALHRDPYDIRYHERWPLFPFLVGASKDQKDIRPRLLKGKDYLKLNKYKNELQEWAINNCKLKE